MRIVVIGAGFTGSMVAVHLARSSTVPLRISLVERGRAFGAGVAYSTPYAAHTLNVPAGRMSAFPDDPEHFLRWARERRNPIPGGSIPGGAVHGGSIHGGAFLPRALYGEYLRGIVEQTAASVGPRASIERVCAEAVAIERAWDRGAIVRFGDGSSVAADVAVLAIGNYPPADPPCQTTQFYTSDRYQRDPWAAGALDADPEGDVLLLGTGLTMLDVAIALESGGHRGRIHAISRRGQLPHAHRDSTVPGAHHPPAPSLDRWPRTALGMCRELRREVEQAARHGVDWREVVTSLRSITPALWKLLPPNERARFLTHLRPFWETHRHRCAPEVGSRIDDLRRAGRLNIAAGRIERYDTLRDKITVTYRPRGGALMRSLVVTRVINCTGPDSDMSRVRDPLVRSLRASGLIRPDELGLGIDTDDSGRVLTKDGRALSRVLLAGPLRKGQLWENTAVPELREEARRLAGTVLSIAEQGVLL